MRTSWLVGGFLLILLAIIFTIFTLGLGSVCTVPMFIIGIIIFFLGLIIPEHKPKIVQQQVPQQPPVIVQQSVQERVPELSKQCPSCGRSIPSDAKICPYCGEKI